MAPRANKHVNGLPFDRVHDWRQPGCLAARARHGGRPDTLAARVRIAKVLDCCGFVLKRDASRFDDSNVSLAIHCDFLCLVFGARREKLTRKVSGDRLHLHKLLSSRLALIALHSRHVRLVGLSVVRVCRPLLDAVR